MLDGTDPALVRSCVREIGGGVLRELQVSLTAALSGSEPATRRYVRAYRELTERVLEAVRKAEPERVVAAGPGLVIAVHGRPSRTYTDLVLQCAAYAPFTSWASNYELGDAVALDLASRLREIMGTTRLPQPEAAPPADFDSTRVPRRRSSGSCAS